MKHFLTYLFLLSVTCGFGQEVDLLPDTLRFCVGDSAHLEIKSNYDNYSAINWITPNGIISNTNKVNASKAGKYFVRANSAYFSKQFSDSCFVLVLLKPKSAIRDTFFCKNMPIVLNAKNEGLIYLWNTGERTQTITVSKGNKYWVKISNGICSVSDTILVNQLQGSGSQLPKEMSFCLSEPNKLLTVKANAGTNYLWNTGATSSVIPIFNEGVYWVRTEIPNCGSKIDSVTVSLKVCECEMMIPNSFTPNEDGRNDYFFPVMQCEYSYFNLTITDRWANTVFTAYQSSAKWDGRFKGNLCPEDIYIYKIESIESGSQKKQVRSGHLSLIR